MLRGICRWLLDRRVRLLNGPLHHRHGASLLKLRIGSPQVMLKLIQIEVDFSQFCAKPISLWRAGVNVMEPEFKTSFPV